MRLPLSSSHPAVGGMAVLSLISILFLSCGTIASAREAKKKAPRIKPGKPHQEHDQVHVIVNKVGPFNNPTETYRYYSLPYCQTHSAEEEHETLDLDPEDLDKHKEAQLSIKRDRQGALKHKQRIGQTIVGDRRESSPFELTYLDDVEYLLLCAKKLSPDDIQKFKDAIQNNYFFEMFIDDLPMWGYIGEVDETLLGEMVEGAKTYLYTHLHFKLGYDELGRIVTATLSTQSDRKVDITDATKETAKPIPFSYSVEWYQEKTFTFRNRMSRYSDNRFLPGTFEIHWLSIINAFVLVLLLTAFLTIIMMRVLKNDLSRYMDVDEETIDEEETGWKLIHGDVFRFPSYPDIFCACVGCGLQLLFATFSLLTLALMGVVSTTRRGSILAAMIVLYCLSSFLGGYFSSSLYRQMNGKSWVRNIIYTATLFPLPVAITFAYVNSVAIMHGSNAALPFGTICIISALYLLLSFPLTVFGAIVARHHGKGDFNAPTRTTKIARQIPIDVPWYKSRAFQMFIAGFLPFSAIYIELNYIFASIWGHQIYTLFGILFLALVLLVIVTSFITIALLYFQLAREDHKWWWVVYFNGGSTGLFILLYSFVYYFHRSEMSGALQGSFYFGYMAVISYAFFLMLGAAGFKFSLLFVRSIYGRLKID